MERAGAGRYWLVWAAVLPILVWALVRVTGVEGGFPLVPVLAYTPYVAFAALLVAGIAVALRNWAAAAVGWSTSHPLSAEEWAGRPLAHAGSPA